MDKVVIDEKQMMRLMREDIAIFQAIVNELDYVQRHGQVERLKAMSENLSELLKKRNTLFLGNF